VALEGSANDLAQLVHGFGEGLVIAIAIGRFQQHDVGGSHTHGRVTNQRFVDVAQVTAEREALRGAVVLMGELDEGRADDVARVAKHGADTGRTSTVSL
jgi:hypothetical protein